MDLKEQNVRRFLERAVEDVPDEPFLIWTPDGTQLSYLEFNAKVDAASRVWFEMGVRKGDNVAFMVDNCPQFLVAWLGLAKLGGVLVAINTGFQSREVAYLLADSEPAAALVASEHERVFWEAASDGLRPRAVLGIDREIGEGCLAEMLRDADARPPDVRIDGDDLLSLIYTSGTTGSPKGVMQPHRNYVLTGEAYPHWLRMTKGERIYACLPLFHINTQAYSTMGAIGIRGSLVLAPRFSASRFWPDVRRYDANVFNFIGAMTVILAKMDPSDGEADNEVRVAYGVPALPEDLRASIEERFGFKVISGFGMSETTFGLIEDLEGERRAGSMGKPRGHPDPDVPPTRARVVGEDGQELPPGEVGELLLNNTAMMLGYFRGPDRTRAVLDDGWLHTGDSVYVDDDGYYYYFVDRKKDLVRRRGENISSLEVERILNEHPGVLESAVVGVPSGLMDEEVLAFVVPMEGAVVEPDELVEWARERLASFKVPRYIEIITALPRTPTEKIAKHELRDREPSPGRFDHVSSEGT